VWATATTHMKPQSNRLEEIVLEIRNNPGLRFVELARICHIPNSTMAYYTDKLEKLGTVKVRKKANECRFFSNQISSHEKTIIIALRKRSHRKILLLLQKKDHLFSDICKGIGLAPSTISAKLDFLVRLGIIEYRFQKKTKMFKIKDPEKTLEVIKRYQHIIKITEP
jgi:predicted transcriptional regulator